MLQNGPQDRLKMAPWATKIDEKLYIGPSCANNSDVNWSPTEPKSISQRSSWANLCSKATKMDQKGYIPPSCVNLEPKAMKNGGKMELD